MRASWCRVIVEQKQANPDRRRDAMWLDRYSVVCRECPDLVAVYEATDRRIALLLRHTLVPLPEEYPAFRRATRNAARTIVDSLRAAGFRRGFVVLQWQPLGSAAEIMRTWSCRYEADAGRRAQLVAVAERFAADERYLAGQIQLRRRATPRTVGLPPPFATSGELHGLQSWYDAMAPSWLSIEPLLRRALVLKTHRWIAERILILAADGPVPALESRAALAGLGNALVELVPPDERAAWDPWVGLVVGDLERALCRPVVDWNQAWARRLLLIAYSVPIPRERLAPAWPIGLISQPVLAR